MDCHELEQDLEMGEVLSADAAAHLNVCASCRALFSDLQAIQEVAGQMPTEVEAPERVWLSLRGQLEAQGLIQPREKLAWLADLLAVLPRPALAGAYLSLLLVAAVLLGLRGNLARNPRTLSVEATPAANALHAQLSSAERRTVAAIHAHNPDVTASVRQNLDIVDNFIALCEKTVREDPRNEMAREYLYGAYQQKAQLLSAMLDRDAAGE